MTVRTIRNLLRCVTPSRAWNLARMTASYRLSVLTGRSIVWGRPYTLTIEPTNRCNLSCPECPSGNGAMTRPQGMLAFDDFRRIVDEVRREVFYLQLFFQGEPFINNRLLDMIRHAHDRRMYVSVSTNAHYIREKNAAELVDSGLDRLIVSIDGLTQEVYEQYRVGGKLAKVHEALELLQRERKRRGSRMELVLQLLVTRQNEEQLDQLRELAQRYNAEIALKTMQVYSIEGAEQFLPKDERYSRYHRVNGELRTKNRLRNRCVRLWERSVITWDGTVVPCCFDKDADHPLGYLNGRSFTEVWQSDEYHAFRRKILAGRKNVEMCRNCTEGMKIYR